MPAPLFALAAVLILACAALAAVLAASLARGRLLARRVAELGAGQIAAQAEMRGILDQARRETAAAAAEAAEHQTARGRAETRLEEAQRQGAALTVERDEQRRAMIEADQARIAAERDAALAASAVQAMEQRVADWETAREESLKSAQAAAFSTLSQMSSKLIEDHQRESEAAKQQQAEQIKTATEGLFGQFQRLTSTVDALAGQVGESRGRLDLVHRALSSPGGAGYFAEIGLENTLKAFGLLAGRDFIMQYSLAGTAERSGLRPDAVVFLPARSLLVIDAKASKFLLELAAAEGEIEEAQARANLARTMNQHLKDLAGREYEAAVRAAAAKAGEGPLGRVINVMYLPNEGALEKLASADPAFTLAATRQGIVPCGPAGLSCLLSFSRQEIDLARQAENQQRIVEQAQSLLESISIALGHMDKVGRGLKSASESFAGLAKSVNSRLLPRARTLVDLGVRPDNAKALPGNLATYQLVSLQSAETIEGEAAEVTLPGLPAGGAGDP